MSTYIWAATGGGSFGLAGNWELSGTNVNGVPGTGDTADFATNVGTVTTNGEGVAALFGHDTTLTGALSVSGMMSNVRLAGGSFSAGNFYLSRIDSGELSAAIVDLGTITGGRVDAGELGDAQISGKAVVLAGSTGSELDTNLGISGKARVVIGTTTLEAGTGVGITLDGGTLDISGKALIGTAAGGGFVEVNGGIATFGAAPVVRNGNILVNGGLINLNGGVSLLNTGLGFSQGEMRVNTGGTAVVAGPTKVDIVQDSNNQGLVVDGGVAQLTGKLALGIKKTGILNLHNLALAEVNAGAGGVILGDDPGSRGTIRLDSGSTLNITGKLVAGQGGTGNILASGSAKFTLTGNAFIGDAAFGSMSILDSGTAAAIKGNLMIGNRAGVQGQVSLANKATLDVTGVIAVGEAGNGRLQVIADSDVSARTVDVGGKAGGTGTVLLSGTGSTMKVTQDVSVGDSAKGELSVLAGARLTADVLFAGFNDGGDGTVLVSGAKSTLNAVDGMIIGNEGTGKLTVDEDGKVTTKLVGVAVGTDSEGTLIVDHATWTASRIEIGVEGSGSAVFRNAATVTFTSTDEELPVIGVGSLEDGVGTMLVNGKSTLVTAKTGTVIVGETGKGTLTVSNNGHLDVDAIKLATEAGGSGILEVQSGGAVFAHNLIIGSTEEKTVGSALVTGQNSQLSLSGADAGLTVSGKAGTMLTVADHARVVLPAKATVSVGNEGGATGAVVVSDGGRLTAGGMLVGNPASGSLGTVSVSGKNSLLTLKGSDIGLIVSGKAGSALTIQDQGHVVLEKNTTLGIGNANGTGSVVVDGEGSLFQALNQFGLVGAGGTGSLTLRKGADAQLSEVEVGIKGGTGRLVVDGQGADLSIDSLFLGDRNAASSSNLILRDNGDAKVDALTLAGAATITLAANSSLQVGGAVARDGYVTIAGNAVVSGSGTIAGSVFDNGTLQAKGGTLTLRGDLGGNGALQIVDGATFDFSKAKGDGQVGELDQSGRLRLGNHDIVVTDQYTNDDWGSGNNFNPHAGVTGTGDIIGKGAKLTVTGDVTQKAGSFVVQFHEVAGGKQEASFRIENSGNGADVTAALQTLGLGAAVKGAQAGNVTLAAGDHSGLFTLTYDPSKGSLNGKFLTVLSNFDNVAPIKITFAKAPANDQAPHALSDLHDGLALAAISEPASLQSDDDTLSLTGLSGISLHSDDSSAFLV
ncbi:hypothetical protein BH10PSE7_BH10PSE7_11480 [soil metagenome]